MPPNPLAVLRVHRFQPVVDVAAATLLLTVLALALASLVVRFHGADRMERRQIGWLGYAVVLTVTASFLAPSWLNAVVSLAIPAAIGVAVVRYRLFDIDIVINRTLVATGLLPCSAVLYIAVVGWLGGLVGERGAVVGFLGAIAVAAAFHPLYVRIQRGGAGSCSAAVARRTRSSPTWARPCARPARPGMHSAVPSTSSPAA